MANRYLSVADGVGSYRGYCSYLALAFTLSWESARHSLRPSTHSLTQQGCEDCRSHGLVSKIITSFCLRVRDQGDNLDALYADSQIYSPRHRNSVWCWTAHAILVNQSSGAISSSAHLLRSGHSGAVVQGLMWKLFCVSGRSDGHAIRVAWS